MVQKAFPKIVSQSKLGLEVVPHLGDFGKFLCGIVGYNKTFFRRVPFFSFTYLMHCLYEIQDISELSLVMIRSNSLLLCDSLDMYAFGYCLVNASFHFQIVHIYTSLEMLVHSLSVHTKKTNGGRSWTIEELLINVKMSVHISSKLTSLIKYFFKIRISSLTLYGISSPLVPVLAEWISKSSPELTVIVLKLCESCENDYILFQSIQHITNLEEFALECCTLTQKGVQELYKIMTTRSTLKFTQLVVCEKYVRSKLFISYDFSSTSGSTDIFPHCFHKLWI